MQTIDFKKSIKDAKKLFPEANNKLLIELIKLDLKAKHYFNTGELELIDEELNDRLS